MSRSFSHTLTARLAAAERVVVLTGAGTSAESGIPTFRDPGGLWQQFRPEELAHVEAFLQNPTLVQGWYAHREKIARATAPHAGHRALAALEALVPDFTLVTQNVDGLHQRAGSQTVVELHGNLTRSYCIECGTPAPETSYADGGHSPDGDASRPPRQCASCGGLVRPDVVWFGEALPQAAVETAWAAAERAEVLLSVGTSAVVYPAAALPGVARRAGAFVAEINVAPSAIADEVDEVVVGKAGEVLPALVEALRQARTPTHRAP